jgi:hypothetical protein
LKQENYGFKGSLVYIGSLRPSRITQWDLVSFFKKWRMKREKKIMTDFCYANFMCQCHWHEAPILNHWPSLVCGLQIPYQGNFGLHKHAVSFHNKSSHLSIYPSIYHLSTYLPIHPSHHFSFSEELSTDFDAKRVSRRTEWSL